MLMRKEGTILEREPHLPHCNIEPGTTAAPPAPPLYFVDHTAKDGAGLALPTWYLVSNTKPEPRKSNLTIDLS